MNTRHISIPWGHPHRQRTKSSECGLGLSGNASVFRDVWKLLRSGRGMYLKHYKYGVVSSVTSHKEQLAAVGDIQSCVAAVDIRSAAGDLHSGYGMLADSPRAGSPVEGSWRRVGDLEADRAVLADKAVRAHVEHVTVRVRHAPWHVDVASGPQLLRDAFIRLPIVGSRLADAPRENAGAPDALHVDARRLARTSV